MENDFEDLAFDYLEKAIEEIPSDAEAYFQLGELHLWRNEPQSALECFKKILDFNPYHVPAKKKIAQIEL
jgi:tetratricopeptide (TPR) repeat protein